MKRFSLVFTILLGLTLDSGAAQLYYSAISINSGQVPSTQTNFPVLVSQTDNRFKTTGNGGHVANANGFDIRPYSDTGLTTALDYWLERYNATTGEVIMWVKVASLSSSTTPIYLGYGDTALTTDGSNGTNVFVGSSYPLKDGTTLSVADARGTFNGTNNGATATTGQIDGAANFVSASSQYFTNADSGTWADNADTSLSMWVKTTTTGAQCIMCRNTNTGAGGWLLFTGGGANSNLSVQIKSSGGTAVLTRNTTATTANNGSWHHVAVVFHINTSGTSGQDIQIYYDGALNQGSLTNSAAAADDGSAGPYWGRRGTGSSQLFFDGQIDDIRYYKSTALSADWIATTYNTGFPGTFETLGSEVAVSTATGNFFLLFP